MHVARWENIKLNHRKLEENERHVQNENYFIKVFVALKHTQNPKILKKLLSVIKFYINQDNSKS